MDSLDYNEKNLVNDIPYQTNAEEKDDIDELIVMYFFKCCSCGVIFISIFQIFFLWFPIFPIMWYFREPYKRIIQIDKKSNTLLVYDTGLISCCKLTPKPYSLNNIKKIRIYVYSMPDPKVGFNKLYFVNCEIYSLNGEKEELFHDTKYDKEIFDKYEQFFKKYFETEIEPLEVAKDKSEYNINSQLVSTDD